MVTYIKYGLVLALSFSLANTSLAANYQHNKYRYQQNYQQTYVKQKKESGGFFSGLKKLFKGNQQQTQNNARYNRYNSRNQYSNQNRYHQQKSNYRNNNRYQPKKTYVKRDPTPAPTRTPTVRYGNKLCETGKYTCVTVKRGQSWKSLFKDPDQRDLVKRLNRMNTNLWAGMKIAVPPNLATTKLLDLAPFNKEVDTKGEKLIVVSLPKLAWAAYNEDGEIVRWGPVSGGKDYCPDIGKPCNTIRGVFSVFYKKNQYCISNTFPANGRRGSRGAPMPYCMFFHGGFALHGSNEVPGYNASHGCVRMYKEDAQWLNEDFVELPQDEYDKGTQVIVLTSDEGHKIEQIPEPSEDDSDFDDLFSDDYDTSDSYHRHYKSW